MAKLNKLASVPRRDLLNSDSVVIGEEGNTGPKTSPSNEILVVFFSKLFYKQFVG